MKELTISLPIYYTQYFKTKKSKTFLVGLNWYRNAHHSISNSVKHYYHELVYPLVVGNKFNKVMIEYRVYAGRKGTDGHNIRAILEKFFLDGFVEAGCIEDDNIDFVIGDSSKYFIDRDNPRIDITVKEVI
jgi:hypothetical protein